MMTVKMKIGKARRIFGLLITDVITNLNRKSLSENSLAACKQVVANQYYIGPLMDLRKMTRLTNGKDHEIPD